MRVREELTERVRVTDPVRLIVTVEDGLRERVTLAVPLHVALAVICVRDGVPDTLLVCEPEGVRLRVTVDDQVLNAEGLDRVPEGERVCVTDAVYDVERV